MEPARALPKREQEICTRLRTARNAVGLTQEEFAAQIGITRQRLASYEEMRAPLRFDIALRLCRVFIISELWLAKGEGDMRAMMDLTTVPVATAAPVDARFSEAF